MRELSAERTSSNQTLNGTEIKQILMGLYGCTRREADVALVVGEGLTNTQASTRLCVGIKTVEFHLTNAYKKLDLDRPKLIKLCDQLRERKIDYERLPRVRDAAAKMQLPRGLNERS